MSSNDFTPGDLVTARIEGYGDWPCVVLSRDAYVRSTAKTQERLAPRNAVYILTLGDRQLTYVDPKCVRLLSDKKPHPIYATKIFHAAMKEKEDYINRKIKQFALWFYKNHRQPYVAEFVSVSGDEMILKTIEATMPSNPSGEEVVQQRDWGDICFIGNTPLSVAPFVVVRENESKNNAPERKKPQMYGTRMTAKTKRAFEDLCQKRLASEMRKKQREAECKV